MEVHDRHDNEPVWFDREEHPERKCSSEATTNLRFDNGIECRVEHQPVEGLLHAGEKAFAEILLMRFVPRGGLDHFRFGLGMETDGFHPRAA